MSKRRRTSSIASRTDEETLEDPDTSTNSGPTVRKRKRADPSEVCQLLYDTIRNYKKEDGALLCDAFIRAPKRRQEPGYYDVVSNPIDLLKVQQKLKTDEYEDPEDMTTDVELMVKNAKAFYKKNSQEYKDACDLWDLFLTTKNRIIEEEIESKSKLVLKVGKARKGAGSDSKKSDIDIPEDISESSTNPDDDINLFEDLFTAVMLATDVDNRSLHTAFQLLPSKKKYPEYYEVIESPIDLKIIATKIQNNEYSCLAEMEKDLLLMTKNACLFNEPGSQIYKDAKALKKTITSKKIEIEHGKFLAGKSSERIRNKRLRGVQSLSAVTAALKDEESETEVDEVMDEDIEIGDPDNPQWQLFATVRKETNNQGNLLSEPFWKLPSKRYYPDYYKEIKNPVSLSQIKMKLTKGDYGTVSEVAGDMNIMFENAKKYNVHTSKLYKDTVKLQKLMQLKVQELLEIDQYSDSDAESEDSRGLKKKVSKKLTPNSASKGRYKDNFPLKRKLHILIRTLIEYACEDGRQPLLLFMEKPSKKLYPDYYQVIAEPIDVITIESNIKNEKYTSEEELINDFKLMFSNCRQYNEENSMVYNDSILLEKILMDKVKELNPPPEKRNITRVKPRKILTPLEQKLRTLYDAIRDYREPKSDRQLALIFMKLPSKSDYPDYYEVIKQPIDMEKISAKLRSNIYETLEELVSDFILMFDNACKYNEPDSQIYKDALILQRVCLQTKQQIKDSEGEDTVPDVQGAVQDLLASLFTSVYNHQDEEGRCYSDSMAELAEHDEVDGKKIRALSLDLIKRRLDRGVYRRLDVFQEDMFSCLERARRLSRTDSQVFEDSIELQSFFIRQRDELCRNGDLLQSPALNYTLMDLTSAIETAKQQKLNQEIPEEESESRGSDSTSPKENIGDSMTCNQRTFRVGEFVYIDPKEKGIDPSIIVIERLWTNSEGQQMLYGNYFLRPSETYHVTTRKFLEKEVFKSDAHIAVPLNEVKDRCCVLNIKDYIKMRPEGYADKDVYVCESRYSTRARAFKKIKVWPVPEGVVKLVDRAVPLEPRRVMSVFRERVEKHKDELAELAEQENLVEKDKPNVIAFTAVNENMEEGNVYYEQYNTMCSGVVKTGDFVYVVTDGGRQMIAQIDTIWETKDGKNYFRGPWLVIPSEIPHLPLKMFYKQEVFMSTVEDTNPIVGIVGKCSVLEYTDYISSRLTEIPETDVFVCESTYDEMKRTITKLPTNGLKRYSHSQSVTEDEIYYFRRLINPQKVKIPSEIASAIPEVKVQPARLLDVEASPLPKLTADVDMLMEDSLDGGPPSVGSGDIPIPTPISAVPMAVTPVSSKKAKGGKKIVTGYILYSSEVRKTVAQNNPESTFGEISRIVGNEWRSLPAGEKQSWEEKAARCNEESAASPASAGDFVFECLWGECDYQFEDLNDCLDHCLHDNGSGCVQQHFAGVKEPEYQCHWRGCIRIRKSAPSFPQLLRLARHVREVHINKGNGRFVVERSKNYVPSKKNAAAALAAAKVTSVAPTTTMVSTAPVFTANHLRGSSPTPITTVPAGPNQKPAEPLFISIPPTPTRVMHSEAYIKYIEGLNVNNKFMCPWEKTLTATSENTTVPDPARLPKHWLENGASNHPSITAALWSLRDLMLRDVLMLQNEK